MTTLPTLSASTLDNIHAVISSEMLGVSDLEKWVIGNAALLLNDSGTLDLDSLERATERRDKQAINTIIKKGNVKRHEALKLKINHPQNGFNLDTELYGDPIHDHNGTGECDFLATITPNCYAYNIQPLEYLLDTDAAIMARVISMLRRLFICSPLPEDMESFGCWRLEIIETLEEWFPESIRKASNSKIKAYWNKHKKAFIDDTDGEFDDEDEQESLISDYLERNEPRPTWYPLLTAEIKGAPKRVVSMLKKEAATLKNTHAKVFADSALASMSDYLKHFKSNKDLNRFESAHRDLDIDARTRNSEDPEIDMGFMMAWGTKDTYWWRLLEDVNQMMMETGESPCYGVSVRDKQSRDLFALSSERLYRGASMLDALSILTDTLELDHD